MERLTPTKDKTSSLMRPAILLPLLIGIILGVLLSVGFMRGPKTKSTSDSPGDGEQRGREENPSAHNVVVEKEAQRNAGFKIAEAAERPMTTTLQATGVVTPNESRVAHIRPLARGLIEQIYVRLGDRV